MKKTIIVLVFIFTALMCFSTGCSKTHDYGTLIAQTDATCVSTGMKAHYKCAECNEYFDQDKKQVTKEDLVIAVDNAAHDLEWVFINDAHVQRCKNQGCTQSQTSQTHVMSESAINNGEQHYFECIAQGCSHKVYGNHDFGDGVGSVKTIGTNTNYVKTCAQCGDHVYPTIVVDKPNGVQSAISNAENGTAIFLKAGTYSAIAISSNVDGIILVGESGTVVNKLIIANGSNIILNNITFTGSVVNDGVYVTASEFDGLNIYNCKFKNHATITADASSAIKNLVVYNCDFNLVGTNVTAIKIQDLNGLTLKNNTFTYVPYNVIQVGEGNYVKGNIVITGNKFIYVGSRMLYFVRAKDISSCDISGNWFYDNSEYCNKDTGCYFKISGQGITIGVNYWENIPEITDDTYFECVDFDCELTEYDESAQQSIPIE